MFSEQCLMRANMFAHLEMSEATFASLPTGMSRPMIVGPPGAIPNGRGTARPLGCGTHMRVMLGTGAPQSILPD
jgi:hypothetical protein